MTTLIDKAFKKAFGDQVGELITADSEQDTYRGKHWQWPSLDRGEWAPKSLLIIYHESGLPDSGTHHQMFPFWTKLEEELSEVFGFEVFRENINGAVSAIYAA